MADKMLIDASHTEETRVVVVRGNRIEEFDFESQHKKQLRGNIYLAKVTRVEPSLQAAFVDYGGNRHGFLAFSEIHPDYYQIPLADRQALLAAEAEDEAARARDEESEDNGSESAGTEAETQAGDVQVEGPEDDDAPAESALSEDDQGSAEPVPAEEKKKSSTSRSRRSRATKTTEPAEETPAPVQAEVDRAVKSLDGEEFDPESGDDEENPREISAVVEVDTISEPVTGNPDEEIVSAPADFEVANHVEGNAESTPPARSSQRSGGRGRGRHNHEESEDDNGRDENEKVESVGAEDALEELPDRSVRKPRKQYRIQEVIKRRQILLVQVVKEERGNKGAALTTYLSLAGRYSVLMPNTARGGGISRKITNVQDRKRLKDVAKSLDVPQGMGVILRTAGANRTKTEIKRDFEYLMRLWENVRNLTLASTAPCLVYEEGSLIKRSIRDLYNRDISEIIVSGEAGYREAKDFMKMLMPSHAKVVQPYREVHPIFSRSGIEAQLDRMLQPQVTLKSGGYIIMNQTEALVAIDVNSGRSTKEHSIEDTALQTNLEAAEEVARQLRLRDLAGLIVVDFIDMEEKRNNRAVEKRLKDALKNDRARIQVGRISHFGLLEMSRQRIRASVLESTTQICDHCGGTGHVRSQSSVALHVIRSIEEFLLKSTTHDIIVRTRPDTALYVLNHKRDTIVEMERRFGVSILIEADTSLGSAHFAIDRGEPVESPVKIEEIRAADVYPEEADDDRPVGWDEDENADEAVQPQQTSEDGQNGSDDHQRRRRRRRRGRDRNGDHDGSESLNGDDNVASNGVDDDNHHDASENTDDNDGDDKPRKRRRRGKRGGRRNRSGEDSNAEQTAAAGDSDDAPSHETGEETPSERADVAAAAADLDDEGVTAEAVAPPAEEPESAEAASAVEAGSEPSVDATPDETATAEKPKRKRAPRRKKAETGAEAEALQEEAVNTEEPQAEIAKAAEEAASPVPAEPESETDTAPPAKALEEPVVSSSRETAERPKRGGWWQRRGFF